MASKSEKLAANSILDTNLAVETIKEAIKYAKTHGLKVFKVTIEKVEGQ